MGTPRSEKGFQEAIEEINNQLVDIEEQLLKVEGDSEEEAELIQKKADLSVEKVSLEEKFQAFLDKQAEDEDQSVEDEGQAPDSEADQGDDQDKEEKPAEKVWPKTVTVRASDKAGYMVNPFDHTKIRTDYKEVVCDSWTISQIEAGILLMKEE